MSIKPSVCITYCEHDMGIGEKSQAELQFSFDRKFKENFKNLTTISVTCEIFSKITTKEHGKIL